MTKTGLEADAKSWRALPLCWAYCGRLGLLLLSATFAADCSKWGAGADPRRAAQDVPVPVRVAVAVQQDVPVQIRSIARVEPFATVTVKPQVAGQLIGVHFVEGQDVKTGDLLYTIDARPFEAALRQAEGTLAKDTALAEDAVQEAARETSLFEQGVATQREYDNTRALARSLEAAVRADTAAVENARLQLEYCTIRSPIDGRTGSRLADQGNIVKANETNLVIVNQVNPIYVTLSVPERYLPQVKEYRAAGELAVEALIPASDGLPERGVLTFVDNQVDRTTGTILLKGTFANERRRLWPGQFVNATLTLTTRSGAVVVPSAAVQTGQSGQFIFVVQNDLKVESRPVVTGPAVGDGIVIERGISAGEQVVTDGQLRLVPGARVSIKEDEVELRPTSSAPASTGAKETHP